MEGESASDSFHFDIEVRGDIVSVGKFSFAWSFMSGAYVRYPDAPNFGSLNLSTGVGCFYNWKDGMRSLTGPCIFLYPVYGIPVYTAGFTPFFKWKASVDVGYNFLLFNFLTVYLYEKNILLWTENKFTCLPDIGIAVGVYIK